MGPRSSLALVSGRAALVPLVEASAEYAREARSPRTRAAYARQWRAFATWCSEHDVCALPASPATVAAYLSDRARGGWKVATMAQALAALCEGHGAAGHPSPRSAPHVRETWKGIKRKHGAAQTRKAPLLVDELRAMVRALPASRIGARDRALLALGFAGAFRRSELVALEVADVAFGEDGATITIRRSKTDQEAEGATIGVPFGSDPATCPVRALRAWLAESDISLGPLFREVDRHGRVGEHALSDRSVARVVKRAAERAGLDASRYAGHSLRAGLATTAAKAGKGDRAIMRQGRWRSRAMVDRYVRDASLFDDNAASGIGL